MSLHALALSVFLSAAVPEAPPLALELSHGGKLYGAALSLDGRLAASGGGDNELRLWDLRGGAQRWSAKHASGVTGTAFSPDGERVAATTYGGEVTLWETRTGKRLGAWEVSQKTIYSLALYDRGRRAAVGSHDGAIRLWDLEKGAPLAHWAKHTLNVEALAVSPDGRRAYSASHDRTMVLWDLREGKPVAEWPAPSTYAGAFSRDGKRLAYGDMRRIVIRDAATGAEQLRLEGPRGVIESISFSPDGRLASADAWGKIWLWDRDGKQIASWAASAERVEHAAFSEDGKALFTAAKDGALKVWDVSRLLKAPEVFAVAGTAAPVMAEKPQAATAPAPAPAAASDVDAPPAARTAASQDAYAVVIGIEKYRQEGMPGVDFASRDAAAVYAYLTRAMGYDKKNVVLLQDERAAKSDLDVHLGPWLKNRVTEKSRVFVYYAGHGAPNPRTGDAYLIPYDGNPTYAEETSFPVKRLYEALAKLPTRDVTVVLDACFSGAGGRSVIAKGTRPLVTGIKGASAGGANTVVLTATGPDQVSTYYPDGRHGLLTYFLLKGPGGAADSDKDGSVTTAELFGYVAPQVEREARLQNVEQTPTLTPGPEGLGERARSVWVKLK